MMKVFLAKMICTPRFLLRTTAKFITTSEPARTHLSYQEIPRPKSLPLIGTKLDLIAAGSGAKLHEYVDRRHKTLGPIFCEKMGVSEIVFVSDPRLMKQTFLKLEGTYPEHILPEPWILYEKLYGSRRGLFFMHGEEWHSNRKIMNKVILRENSETWLKDSVTTVIDKFINTWKNKLTKETVLPDMESEFYRLSVDVIVGVLLGPNSSIKRSHHHEELLSEFAGTVKEIFKTTTKLFALPVSLCQRFNLKVWRDFKESVDVSLALAQKLVLEIVSEENFGDGLIKKLREENMPQSDITRIVADFVIAAGDTTTYTLLWTLYLLSKNPQTIDELRQAKMDSYVKCVVKESMRLYPVAPFLTRILPKESILGSYQILKKTPIVASIYTSGRDEAYFSRAEEFLPHRWDRTDKRKLDLQKHDPSATLPFALGARSCIGKQIAMLQLTEFIKQVVYNFDFKCTNEGKLRAVMSQVLVPETPIKMIFTPRDKQ